MTEFWLWVFPSICILPDLDSFFCALLLDSCFSWREMSSLTKDVAIWTKNLVFSEKNEC